MLKRDEINDPNSTLNKAADDEPIFILRAQDLLAPAAVMHWARLANDICGVSSISKTSEAARLAGEMIAWPSRKMPD